MKPSKHAFGPDTNVLSRIRKSQMKMSPFLPRNSLKELATYVEKSVTKVLIALR